MKELYLKLKQKYIDDTMYSSFHDFKHTSFKSISEHENKINFLPIILNELKNNDSWFDIIIISYIIPIPTTLEIRGQFGKLKKFYISFLRKKIRKLKLNNLNV